MNIHKTIKLYILILASIMIIGCKNQDKESPSTVTSETFNNPIIAGFNPDPSILRVGEDYYMVQSTFAYFPGLPILHSKDLVHWNQIGSAIDRNEQMSFIGHGISRGLFAPTIEYHDGWYYIVCTLIDTGGNFIVKSRNPEGPYTIPFYFPEVDGIDPSIFFDDDGKVYMVYNSVPPNNESLYSGHRTIRMWEIDIDAMKVLGEEKILVNGGTDIAKKPVWIEAPHLYKKDGYYYLMAAEGGTGYNHSEVIFRTRDLNDSLEVFNGNPILTQRHLDPSRPNPITTTGHADIVSTPAGEWWAVFLGCRPYKDNYFNTGRETFMTPVKWENGWPIINPDYEEVQYQYPVPSAGNKTKIEIPLNGNFTYRIDFDKPLDKRWLFLRNVTENWYHQETAAGTIALDLRPIAIDDENNPSLIVRRQTHLYGEFTTQIKFLPKTENEMAGLVIMQNDNHYYFINKTKSAIQVLKKSEEGYEELANTPYTDKSVHMKITADGEVYHFKYSDNGSDFHNLITDVDATYLSTETAGGFVGCMYGLYASSNGESSENQAFFNYVEIENKDKTNK